MEGKHNKDVRKKEVVLIRDGGKFSEYVETLVPYLFSYSFEFVSSHGEVFLRESSFFVYPEEVLQSWSCSGCNSFGSSDIIIETPAGYQRLGETLMIRDRRAYCFFDIRKEARELIEEACCIKVFLRVESIDNIVGEIKDVIIGGYCPRFSIFVATDWTHTREGALFAQQFILPKLAKELGWKEKRKRKKDEILKFKNFKLRIGADPEFEELDSWSMYTPVPTSFSGTDLNDEIGADGAGDQIELRPSPASSPKELVKKIKSLIERIEVPVSVKGDRYPLGAHIHFELPEEVKKDEGVIKKICMILDDFLGKRLIDLSGAARGRYKILSAFEKKRWGFEYRSLPSAFLVDPEIARIVFKIAFNVVQSLLRRGRVRYYDPPLKEDYMRLGGLSEREYMLFERFLSEYKEYDGRAINANWTRRRVIKETVVRFADDWKDELKMFMKNLLEKSRRVKGQRILIYGLRKDRGDDVIAGLEMVGYRTIPHPISSSGYDVVVGLPRWIRMAERGLEASKKELTKVYKAIVKAVKNKKEEV